MIKNDLTGQRFGRLTVLGPLPPGRDRKTRWRCLCDCGEETVINSAYHLTSGNTKSCGCLHHDSARDRHYKHGGKGTRLYNIWKNARQRCNNPKATDYKLYGGRGVKFSDRWANFSDFREWAEAHGYTNTLTLDRIDPNEDYSPENCRWATWKEQRHNQRRCKEVIV
jgi:hypothetical protein